MKQVPMLDSGNLICPKVHNLFSTVHVRKQGMFGQLGVIKLVIHLFFFKLTIKPYYQLGVVSNTPAPHSFPPDGQTGNKSPHLYIYYQTSEGIVLKS